MADSIGFDPVAWAIDGGRLDAEVMRVLAYAATGGAEGIVTPGDCKVVPLTTPGPQVAINPGALIVRNSSAGARNQSYVANGRTQSTLDVNPTTSAGGRSDAVIVRLRDPEYAPWPAPPASEAPTYQYTDPEIIYGVPASTTKASQLNLGYSAVMLARIDRPANTATITAANIVDVRKVANPRRERVTNRYNITYSPNDSNGSNAQGPSWHRYPDIPQPVLEIPDWAGAMVVRMDVDGIMARDAALAGWWTVFIGPSVGSDAGQAVPAGVITTDVTYFNQQTFGDTNLHYMNASKVVVPANFRGTTQTFSVRMKRGGGAGFFRSNAATQVVLDVEFLETAV